MLTFIQHSCNSGSVSECIRKSWRSQFSKEPTAEDEAHDERGGAGTPGFLTLQRFGWATLLLHQPPGRFIARAEPNSPQLYSHYTALIYKGCALRGWSWSSGTSYSSSLSIKIHLHIYCCLLISQGIETLTLTSKLLHWIYRIHRPLAE